MMHTLKNASDQNNFRNYAMQLTHCSAAKVDGYRKQAKFSLKHN